MYFTRALRVIAPALLGTAIAGSAASAYVPTAVTVRAVPAAAIVGLYNLTFVAQKSGAERRMDLILEHGDGVFTALLLDATQATALEKVAFDGETLRANATTNVGRGELVLHFADDGVSGTMTIGTHTIAVKGARAH